MAFEPRFLHTLRNFPFRDLVFTTSRVHTGCGVSLSDFGEYSALGWIQPVICPGTQDGVDRGTDLPGAAGQASEPVQLTKALSW